MVGYPDSDAEERADLSWGLEQELHQLDVEDVSRPSTSAPEGAKGSALDWAQLVVSFAGSLPALVAAVRAWQGRHKGATVTIEIDGDKISLSDPSASERSDLLDAWLARHGR